MIEIANVALPLDTRFDELDAQVLRLSVDARRRDRVHFVATLGLAAPAGVSEQAYVKQLLAEGKQARIHAPYEPLDVAPWPHDDRPVVVGSGPAGLFAALYLARAGARPIVVERGAALEQRVAAVAAFDAGGPLHPRANIQFGEGGAGTFSDGKLTTNIKNPLTKHVLRWFVEAGAPAEIEVLAKPHIGTDVLRGVVRRMRDQIVEAGGEFRFETQLVGVELDAARASVEGAQVLDASACAHVIPTRHIILACGHSARDTFDVLHRLGVPMEQKPFSVGVRIEHNQQAVNRAQYGTAAGHPGLAAAGLAAADYKLAVHLENGRSVYTFCMCPGGRVVCAASEEGGVVVNGMSNHARDGENANSAVLVNVVPDDFGGDHPLAGVRLQQELEQRAFCVARAAGGAPYQAPAQRVGDFLHAAHEGKDVEATDAKRASAPSPASVQPTYARGVVWCDLHDVLPEFVTASLEEALPLFDRRLHGFADPGAVMTGVETRSSSPVRIVRDESCQSPAVCGLYPCGEGAGYAGGIMSAAVDGLRVARMMTQGL